MTSNKRSEQTTSEQTIKFPSKLSELKTDLAQKLFNMSPIWALEKGICIQCKEPALPKCYSAAGRKEYHISALCEQCFDTLFE